MNTSNSIPPAVCLAFDCIARARKSAPKTGAGYHFDRSDYSDQIDRSPGEKVIYHNQDGERCTQATAAKILGLSESGTWYLFNKHKSDYKYIYANHGLTGDGTVYKDPNGNLSTPAEIAKYYKTTQQAVRRYFKKAGKDYKKANADLLARS